ncbi:MAG TPA: ABATE domain-containing protein [Pseudonocardiaceae bacterium]|jgi:predicted RNA-binding Zn ribbon-like protein|nr:ABATE domain-containing protein [Pseudonocardiaceae bacterium]
MSVQVMLEDLQRAGFPMGGEPFAALDLVDTVMLSVEPPVDLFGSPERFARWWELEGPRLPQGPPPDLAATRRLRAAVRDLFDAHLAGRAPRSTSIEDVNAATAAAPASLRMVGLDEGTARVETRWHTEYGGNAALAALAREAIEVLSSPERLERLRRCANPTCSMLFLAENKRRQWCTANICGNRARVARHYERTHMTAPDTDAHPTSTGTHEGGR